MSLANVILKAKDFATEITNFNARLHSMRDARIEQQIFCKLGVDLASSKFAGKDKWSTRLKATLLNQGKPATEPIVAKAKYLVASAIASNPKNALNQHKRNSIDALVQALERMLKT